jgi:hypothetical protein
MRAQLTVTSRDILGEPESAIKQIARISKEIYTYESLLDKFKYKISELKSLKVMLELENIHELDIVREFI